MYSMRYCFHDKAMSQKECGPEVCAKNRSQRCDKDTKCRGGTKLATLMHSA